MLAGWVIVTAALLYLLLLFAIASYGDRRTAAQRGTATTGRPLIYALSLAVYCTSWTYFGGVGLAAQRGYEFLAIYFGPILMFTIGMPVLRRIVNLAKAEKLTSIADFIAARYGKNPTVAGIVAAIAVVGTIPYIALQLKAVASSVTIIITATPFEAQPESFLLTDMALVVTLLLAGFSVIFGTRHTDATEHQNGLILAVAMESVVKLIAFTAVGLFATFVLFDGPGHLLEQARQSEAAMAALSYDTSTSRWIVLTMLSAVAIVVLPRQFHVTVVENRTESELKTAGYLFPIYLIAINLFVIPIALAGVLTLQGTGTGDQYVLLLPLANDISWLSLATFIGGFSAATAMVIVASVAVAIMISNDIVMPVLLRQNIIRRSTDLGDFTGIILKIRRTAIFCILLLGYAYYRSANIDAGLASIGLLSFAAMAQFAPALFGGLIWKGANARGAIVGLCGGMLVWAYLLFVPSLGGPDNSHVAAAVLDFLLPGTDVFSGDGADPFVNSVLLSLLVNMALFVTGSLSRPARPLERMQAGVFIPQRSMIRPTRNEWQSGITVKQLKQAITKYLGAERTERSFHTYETTRGRWLEPSAPADMDLVRYAEQLLGSAIGSASARLVLSLLFQKEDDTSSDTARLLDEASEALQYNRDLLQSALGQMDQGITVFDRNNRLSVWNRRFRSLLDLPESVGQVGVALEDIVQMLADRGDIRKDQVKGIIDSFLTMDVSWTVKLVDSGRIIEIRSNPMPDSGVVTTYADITERVASAKALEQANETLEQRVAERTAELVRVNGELAQTQARAEEANIGKTRFLAAAGHDILQPLNAARLYSSSLVERLGQSENQELVTNIDSSLESVESILGAVLDISRLDTGAMKPQISSFPLNDVLRRIETDFSPLAAECDLDLRVVPTSAFVRSDPNLLRRLIQNLVSNAIKYTQSGGVLVGVRHSGENVFVQVIDTGIGIPRSSFDIVFREFTRLDEGAKTASGLGLGLSIVDRIARVLGHRVHLASNPGKGTDFRVEIPVETNVRQVQATDARPSRPTAPTSLDGLRVLCIDNEPKIVEGLRLLLEGWNCRVATAASLEDLGALLGDQAAPPDAVIADYHLDDGNGIEAITRIRAHWNVDIPAVLATADRTLDVRNRAEERSIAIFNKPLRPAALRAFLNQIAAARKSAAE
ncbi:PAS domain-containing hybrid sensor histidine kinase/response regulator [Hoeflea poritis]|uniref:histidine kinase n=1 Tax=Hoeflea poritis TaxID=2993659 RepID=A0ABT4VTN1_9HYPH|nr:PAS domain-containing hybrid sensor histidine kinase/response regulator [Hoeflea poritis]MDA4848074.1 PAS domain-containing hybrid sensor histidine kinase/response regulator [Hoeflea poritis]